MEQKWKKLFGYFKPYKKVFFADMFFAFLGATITLIIPLIVRYITGEVVLWDADKAIHTIIVFAIVMIILVLIQAYSNFFISYYGHVMGAKIEYDMRNEIFDHYQKLSFSFYDNQKVGQLMSRITNDLFDITELFHHGPEDLVISIIKFFGAFVILLFINDELAFSIFAIIPAMFLFAYVLNRKMKNAFKRNREKIADINTRIEENLSGIRVVKSFTNEEIEKEKFNEGNMGFLISKQNSYRYMGAYHSGLGAFITMITIIVIVVGTFLISKEHMPIADLITFLLYISNFTEPINKLINFTEQFQNGITGYERFYEIISVEPEIKDCEKPFEQERLKGNIVFDKVSFHYEEGLDNVLYNVSLKVREGEYIAIVGASGAGKSTLCSLIPRFYDVTSGSIEIDGIDVRKIYLKDLRKNIGVVQQDVYLFSGSVRENIRYGNLEATDEEIIEAARNANAHDFIMGLPDGYDTYIGQRGIKLSGGQKQRLSIARVFLKNPPILIFDEATSSLDNESEKVVQDSMERLAKNRTTFVIAHRLSTIRNAKRIIVLTDNGIEEEGTHKELIEKNGIYAGLYNLAGV